jgi:hypothetical protein
LSTKTSTSFSMDSDFTAHNPSQLLSVSSNYTDCSVDFTNVVQKNLNYCRFCHHT